MQSVGSTLKVKTYGVINLVVSGDILMESSQHNHSYHTRQEQHNHQRVHNAARKTSNVNILVYQLPCI